MKYPECPIEDDDKCSFIRTPLAPAVGYDPVQRNRDGQAIAGGSCKVTDGLICFFCCSRWVNTMTELDKAQGKAPVWTVDTNGA